MLTWSEHIKNVGRKAAQKSCVCPLPSLTDKCLSIRNGELLYKQLTCHMMGYERQFWKSSAFSRVLKLQVLKSKCLRIATNATRYIGKRKSQEDWGFLSFVDHIRELTESLLTYLLTYLLNYTIVHYIN